ncbi:MAG: HPr family phosphocarrier protein [Lachnospiraceae bacterium]|nr:HPr family phosphocarrier protein [Lachnospiraceae bacterium]
MDRSRMICMTPDQVGSFVNMVQRFSFDVDIANAKSKGRTVDAKSYLGVMGMDLKGDLVVSYNGEDPDFETALDAFKPAEKVS